MRRSFPVHAIERVWFQLRIFIEDVVLELGVVRPRAFFGALSEPLFEFVQQPCDTGAREAHTAWKSPSGLPAQKRAVAYDNTKALKISACCEGLLPV